MPSLNYLYVEDDRLSRDIMEIITAKSRDSKLGIVRASAEMKYFRVKDFKAQYNYQG